jgi:hypothetical protein
VFAVTAWVTLAAMWAGATLTDWLVDRPGATAAVGASGTVSAPSQP